ncbi:MAG: DUF1611 domain-containing protein [Candidatus Eisenbacteria bacterium]|nr:DUF1611 domain-containing protein [Candidatus Eisenbacteria bacterium]
MLGRPRRLALLAEGNFTTLDAKTAVGILRYRPEEVAAVIDSTRAGQSARECVGTGGAVPVVADVAGAAIAGADSLLIGIAPQGGALLESWRATVRDALTRGWDVLAGLHAFLAEDAEFEALAESSGAHLLDVRRPPLARPLACGRAARLRALVVLTVGSDCNVGKMTTALELRGELLARGARVAFVATGQTGIFVADRGVAIDAVPADFMAGAVETLVLDAAREADLILIEGQGALHHPAYSGVTLALLHGAAPAALVLCHEAGRERLRFPDEAGVGRGIPPLDELRLDYERAASWVAPSRVLGISLNTCALEERGAREACAAAARRVGVPATDPVRFGCGALADALLHAAGERSRAAVGDAASVRGAAVHGGLHAPHA